MLAAADLSCTASASGRVLDAVLESLCQHLTTPAFDSSGFGWGDAVLPGCSQGETHVSEGAA